MRNVFWVWIGLAAFALVLVYVASWSIALSSPMALEYEGPCLWAAAELARGHNIYDAARLTSAPWWVMIYTPLYFVVGSWFQHGTATYAPLRAISMIAFLVSLFFLWLLLCRYYKDRLFVSIALLTFASFIPIWSWSWKARVDMLSVSLSIMAIYFFMTALDKLKKLDSVSGPATVVAYLPPALLSVAAVFTKQPSVVVPAVVCMFLLIRKRTFDLAVFVAFCLIFGGGAFSATQVLTNGGFWAHMTFASRMPFSIFDLEKHLSWIGADWPKLWLVALLASAWVIAIQRGRSVASKGATDSVARDAELAKDEAVGDEKKSENQKLSVLTERDYGSDDIVFVLLLTAASGVLTVYTLGTMYANLNHGMIFLVGCAWLIVVFLPALPRLGPVLLMAATVLSTAIMATCLPGMQKVKDVMATTQPVLYNARPIRDSDSQGHNPILFIEDPQLAMISGGVPLFVDPATFLQVWARDGRSLDDFVGALNEKKYPIVVINKKDSDGLHPTYFWNESIMRAIRGNYKKVGQVAANGEIQDVYVAQ